MTGYYKVTEMLKAQLEQDPFVNTVNTGIIEDVLLKKQDVYPYSHIIVNNSSYLGSTWQFSLSVICMDIVDLSKDETTDIFYGNDNQQDVLNTQLAVINRVLEVLRRGENTNLYVLDGTPNCEPFIDRFEHGVAGWTVTFDIVVPNNMTSCSTDVAPVKICPDFNYNIKDTAGNVIYTGDIVSGNSLTQIINNSQVTNSEGTVLADLLSQENRVLADVDNIDSNGLVIPTPMGVPFTCTPIPPCNDANLTLNLSPFLTVASGSDTNIVLKDQTGTEITPLSVVGNEIEVDIPSDSMHLTTATTTTTNILIGTISGVQYQVDWGDGTITTHNSNTAANKTYSTPYAGVIKVWALSGGLTNIDKLRITAGNWNFDISTLKYYVPNLTYLYLRGNLLTGDMSGVANLTSLTYLYLFGNFTGDMSGISNLTSLTDLYLIGNFTINYTSTTFAPNFQRWGFRPITATNPMSSSEIDQMLADAAQTTWAGEKNIYVDGNNGVRTSASDADVATLQAMGVTLYLNV